MKRVFLDQLHWISLARVKAGRETRRGFVDAFEVVQFAAQHGLASFPLDASRYHETWKRGDPRSRQELGRVMYDLSNGHTMAGITDLLDPEAASALARWHGFEAPSPPRVFGTGVAHAFGGTDSLRATVPPELIAAYGGPEIEGLMEAAMIMCPPQRLPTESVERPDDTVNQVQMDGEIAFRDLLLSHGHSSDLAKRAVMAGETIHALGVINRLATARGLAPVKPTTKADCETLLSWMPSKGLLASMRAAAHSNSNFKWEVGDLSDMTSLAVASAYCDVVVTERKWGSLLARPTMPVRARVLTKLTDLATALVD